MRRILVLHSASFLVEALKHIPDVEVATLEPGITGKRPDRVVLDEMREPCTESTKPNDIDRQYGKKYRRSLRR